MSPQIIKILIAGTLLLHGLAHGRALVVLLTYAAGRDSGSSLPVRSWLFPSLAPRTAAAVASVFWFLSTIGFVAASLSFWGTLVPGEAWRQLALASSIISTVGIALFSGTWPGAPSRRLATIDTVIALALNLAVLVCLLLLGWPPYEMFGK